MRLAMVAALLGCAMPAVAQDDADSGDTVELDTLMAPVALFPDPLLAAVLQASVVPLDVVQASRFLDDYAKDNTAVPDADWDPAVLGLLAFPSVLQGMNEHLDWVEDVGDAVTERLPDVQDFDPAGTVGVLCRRRTEERRQADRRSRQRHNPDFADRPKQDLRAGL